MVEEALRILLDAEAEAESIIAAAKQKSSELQKAAEESARNILEKASSDGKKKALAMAEEYEAKAKAEKSGIVAASEAQVNNVVKKASQNKSAALNKAIERIVRANGHR